MARAVRVVTVEQGIDPRDLALLAFGGAGPLHACAVADELGMQTVIVPPARACSPRSASSPRPSSASSSSRGRRRRPATGSMQRARASLAARVAALVPGGDVDQWLDCRYAGQSHELLVADVDEFPTVHEQRNGYARPGVDGRGGGAARAGRHAPAPWRCTDLPAPDRRPRRRPRGGRRARLHALGARAGGPPRPGPAGAWILEPDVNPAELQILGSRLASVADEMGAVLRRAASSPNIKERADCSAALFTATGELLAQAEHIPVHLGSMPASVAAAIATGLRAELMLNDPFAGGTHLNDLTMVAPVRRRRRARRLGREPRATTPTSAAPHPGRCRPTR